MFYHGYSFARMDLVLSPTEQALEFAGFQDWIEEKYDTTICHSWACIILLNSEDDKAAFWKFFDLFEEYLNFVRSED